MNIYTIPHGVSFLDALVHGIMERVEGDPLALANMTILLPTRRSCRALRDAFLRYSHGAPLLLPTMSPIGDMEHELLPTPEAVLNLPPPISPLRQLLLLAKLVHKNPGQKLDIAQAARLARDLASFLGELQTEQVSFDAFDTLIPDEFADHWKHTLTFLRIISHQWPEILKAEGAIDPAEHRNRALSAQIEAWRHSPPQHPIIAAGSTGSMPVTAELLRMIASLPHGSVILPPLDISMDEESWKRLDDCHPQTGLKALLKRMGCLRQHVRLWGTPPVDTARNALISDLMRPAATSDQWPQCKVLPQALEGIEVITSTGLQQEATVIASMMREVLDTPGRTATLITNERSLARRVASLLQRWGVVCDDSAGMPLATVPAAVFLRLLGETVDARMAPISLLSTFKHPLAAGGVHPALFRKYTRELELRALRGARPVSGFSGLLGALDVNKNKHVHEWLQQLDIMAAPFCRLMEQKQADFHALLSAHLACGEALAATEDEGGDVRLWAGDAGEQLADFIRELLEAIEDFGPIDTKSYMSLMDALFAAQIYRPRYGQHPRLTILSPIEARLQHADVMILGELNEDSWPKGAQSDPWVSRPMRAKLGLQLPEIHIGQSAHDFSCYLAAPNVVLTRCEKKDGSPTVPSRWWLRLRTMLGENGRQLLADKPWNQWAEMLHFPEQVIPDVLPAPRPPVSSRPRQLSVTQIEKWMRDPYAVYAAYILKLKRLDPLDADPGAAEFGNFIHHALENFINRYDQGGEVVDLLACGEEIIDDFTMSPAVKMLWRPRFERIADWFVPYEKAYRLRHPRIKVLTETKGKMVIDASYGPFVLTAKADRIDILDHNRLAIIDYKTGTPPSQKDIETGYAPQLTLEALIAGQGGFAGLPQGVSHNVESLVYIRLSGGEASGEEIAVKNMDEKLLADAKDKLEALIAAYDQQSTAYLTCPSPENAPKYNDYAHLARMK